MKKRLRIVHYNHTSVVAGAERVLLGVLPELRDLGIESLVMAPIGPLLTEAANLGNDTAACYPLNARFTLNPVRFGQYLRSFAAAIQNLRKQLLFLHPDVVHANTVRAGLVATAATIGTKLPVVWHVHDTLPRHPFSVGIRALAAASGRTSLIAVSHATARTFCGTLWRRRLAGKMAVIHNVPTAKPSSSNQEDCLRLRIDLGVSRRFLIGCVGQICQRKNQLKMVEIFAEVLKSVPDATLLIVGSALFPTNRHYEDSIKQRIQDLGIASSVRLLGNRSDVPLLLETMDLLVLPSRSEPFPMILLEAMSVSTPIVAFSVDGVPELLEDRRTAWLIPRQDAAQMARTIVWARNHPEQRKRLGSAARAELTKRGTLTDYGRRLAELLQGRTVYARTDGRAIVAESGSARLGETA